MAAQGVRREPRIDMDDELGVVYWMRKFKVPRRVLRRAVEQVDGDVAAVASVLDEGMPLADEAQLALLDASPYVWEHWVSGPPRRFLLCCCPNAAEGHRFKAHAVIRDARGHVVTYLNPPAALFSSSWDAACHAHDLARRWLAEHGPEAIAWRSATALERRAGNR